MSRDFVEMLSALLDSGADFLIVGAHALAAHARPRATGDLDIWIRPTAENAERVWRALQVFGAPLEGLSPADLTVEDRVVQLGFPPARIDLLTSLTGVEFEEAWRERVRVLVQGLQVDVIGREALIRNKRTLGRPRDLADVAELEAEG